MSRWSVYKIVRRPGKTREAVSLGYVNATHIGEALDAAWKRWPKEMDQNQTQAGFRTLPYAKDNMPLGKLHKRP